MPHLTNDCFKISNLKKEDNIMNKLAINGGKSIRKKSWPGWPIVGKEELKLMSEVISSGVWSYNGPKEKEFIRKFRDYIGTKYAVCAANGTVTLQMALEALDIGYGDEVIVPGLTWQATASCCVDINAMPVLVDVEEDSWCIDPVKIEEAITPKTKAIIIVHLYGSNPKIDEIIKIAKENNLYLIEDAAHQHGTVINGKKPGSFGDIGSFSFQQSKGLTSGEGGALTTNKKDLAEKLDALRNCGRRVVSLNSNVKEEEKGKGYYKEEGNFIHSGNYRITEFQAVILLCQLQRLDRQLKKKDENATYLNKKLKEIDGIIPMRREKETQIQAYFNFAFRYEKKYFKNLHVSKFRKALSAELGLDIQPCYEPLNNCKLYRPLTKKRYNINPEYFKKINPLRFSLPVCENAFKNESITFHHSVLLAEKKDMNDILNAIVKIKENVDELL